MSKGLLPCSLLLLLVGCGPDGSGKATHHRTAADGAVENDAPGAWTSRWRLPIDSPTYAIGASEDPDYDFGNQIFVGRMSDGRVVVGTNGSFPLRIYGPNGKLQRKFHSGAGPEEFAPLDALPIFVGCGDTIVAGYVSPFAEFKLIAPDLTIGPPMRAKGMLEDGGVANVTDRDCTGRWFGREELPTIPSAERTTRSRSRWIMIERDLEGDSVLAEFLGGELHFANGAENGPPQPLTVVYGRNAVMNTRDGRLDLAINDRPEIELRSWRSDSVRRIRVTLPAVSVTDADREAMFAGLENATPEVIQMTRQSMTFADQFNYFSDLVESSDGWIWAGRAAPFEAPREYLVFSPEGVLTAQVTLPAKTWIHSVSKQEVLIESRTEDDAIVLSSVPIRRDQPMP